MFNQKRQLETSQSKQHKYAQPSSLNLVTQRTFLRKNNVINQPINTLDLGYSDSAAGGLSNEASVSKEPESFLSQGSYPTHRIQANLKTANKAWEYTCNALGDHGWRLRPGEIFKNRNKVHLKKTLTKQNKKQQFSNF